MSELTEPDSRCERILVSTSGRSLLISFWVAFIVAGLAATLPVPLSTVVGGIAELVVAVLWIGYPIGLFYSLAGYRARSIGVPLIVCGVLLGYGLSVLVYDKSGGATRSVLAPLLGAVLIFAPFVVGAFALKGGENRAKVSSPMNVAVTTLVLFSLPFFGAYAHERFRRVHTNLKRSSH